MENYDDDYMIDVAKEHEYQNQNEEYSTAFLKWRSDKKNPYGYKFVHDTREHTYVDGEGYVEKKPAQAEKKALLKCCLLLGITMLFMLAVDLGSVLTVKYYFGLNDGVGVYYSELYDYKPIRADAVLFTAVCSLLKYIVPIVVFKGLSRLPAKVMLPVAKGSFKIGAFGVLLMLVVMAIGRIGNFLLAGLFGLVKIDSLYYDYIYTDNQTVMLIFFVTQFILVPLLIEILFRGLILQTFRQFGDLFAILITSFVSCLCYYSLSQIGYIFCASLVVGLFTVRSGSIYTAFAMRISGRVVTFIMTYISLQLGYVGGKITETVICLAIFAGAIVAYSRLVSRGDWNFNIKNDESHMTLGEKLKASATSTALIAWIILAFFLTVFTIKII
ncbi:type II CAAX endopeptidase family protein [Ruminococcus sp. Marseille-P6503]|uniref:CPBP family intramembrane glutamic endopeptidase n=1 Tax=Ruminococcus sp. Marseille-P6503 TaxID=2364796 RepID=UPI000F54AD08|nr:type II CAAX endopeptidase family protein [Ruminococcus sp. Marseille-P6503]